MTATRDSTADIWGERTPHGSQGEWPDRVDEQTDEAPERWIQAGCVLCSNSCGCGVGAKGGRTWSELGQLTAIRTALNFFLQQEIDKTAARRGTQPGQPGVAAGMG